MVDGLSRPPLGSPVALVRISVEGVPRFGVVRIAEVSRTTFPEPVVVNPWMVVALVHCAICPFNGVPTFDTLPEPAGV